MGTLLLGRDNAEYVDAMDRGEVRWAYKLLSNALSSSDVMYCDYLEYSSEENGTGSDTDGAGQTRVLDYRESTEYTVHAEKAGWYYIRLEYRPEGSSLSDFSADIKINGEQAYYEMKTIALPLHWQDETKTFPKDGYGDESAPQQKRADGWQTTFLYNNTYSSALPLKFPLAAGENRITVTNVSSDGLGLGALTIMEPDLGIPTYGEYRSRHAGEVVDGIHEINAVSYTGKNSTQAILQYENSPALTPHSNRRKVLNTLSWTEAGTEIEYELEVEKTGYYRLAFHYKNEKNEFDAFETFRIDGEIPFQECISYRFAPTGTSWANEVLSDENGEPYLFYLTAGRHTLSMRAENEPVNRAWRYARLISEHVSQFSLQITKVTGSETDKNRTWRMTRYIPEIADYLKAYEILIQEIRFSLQDYTPTGVNGALLSDFDKAMQFIERMAEYPDEIALYTNDLTGRDNSVLVALSNFTSEILKQDFTLDMIYVYGNDKLPGAEPGFFRTVGNWFGTLANSFTTNKYSAKEVGDDVLTVWVNRAVTHVDLLQKLVDTEFTPRTGIKVKVSIMPDPNKLTLSVAAEQTPDVALGQQVVVTTADDVDDILGALRADGIENINAGLIGWQKNGETLTRPDKAKYSGKIGGSGDFADLIEKYRKLGIDVSCARETSTINREMTGYYNTAAKHVNTWYVKIDKSVILPANVPVKEFSCATPEKTAAWTRTLASKLKKSSSSLTLSGISNILVGTYSRDGVETSVTDAIALYRDTLESIHGDLRLNLVNPNMYLWKYTDRYLSMPVGTSQYVFETDTVPFLQLVLHGTMEMYAPYSNFSFYAQSDILKMIDYNMSPSFILSKEPSWYLADTVSSDLYSTEFAQYEELIQRIYGSVNEVLSQTAGYAWTDRTVLADGVIRNTYQKGQDVMYVLINYTDNSYS